MRRAIALAVALVLSWSLAAEGKRSAPASATRPATRGSDRPPEAHVPARRADDALRRAREIARLNRRLVALARAGKYAQCKPVVQKILRIDPDNGIGWYNLACVHSRLSAPAEAIACLKKALTCGYSDFRYMQRDADFDAIRDLPAYRELLKRNEQVQRRRAEKIRKDLHKRFGEDYICEVHHDRKLVFATNIDRRTLEELKGYLIEYAQAQWNDLFAHRFEQYVTIVVPAAADRPAAGMPVGGYYRHYARMLVARQIGMVMTHEFTHALHDADQDGLGQRHPIWIMEGLATLFETSTLIAGHAVPQPNHRLNLLKRHLARNKTVPWREIVKITHAGLMKKALISYPQVRYMMMYLHRKGMLKTWYDAYTSGYEADPTGAKALEQVFGKPLKAIEGDWLKWVRRQQAPPVRLGRDDACIGVQTRGQADGVRIVRIVPQSGAHKAGLKPGDVIVKVDGQRIVGPAALLRLVATRKVGDRLEVCFRRNGKYDTVTVTLGRFPGSRREPPRSPSPAPGKARPERQRPAGEKAPPTPATRPAKKAA